MPMPVNGEQGISNSTKKLRESALEEKIEPTDNAFNAEGLLERLAARIAAKLAEPVRGDSS